MNYNFCFVKIDDTYISQDTERKIKATYMLVYHTNFINNKTDLKTYMDYLLTLPDSIMILI